MTIKPDNSNTGVQNDDHKTNKDFALLTIIVLLASIIAILVLNHYFYNPDVKFIEMKFDKIGELGGVLQGTLGVAAALAGAYVAIKLAQLAINQAKKSNDIASRQAMNDDPDYLLAREVKAVFTTMRVSHKIIKSMYKSAENVNAKRLISKNALKRLTESLTSNPIYQFLDLETNVTKKDQCIAHIGQLLFCIELMSNENECVKKYEDKYNADSKSAFIAINNVLSDAKEEAATTSIKKFDLSYYMFQVINVEKI